LNPSLCSARLGKTFVALTVLRHDEVRAWFGRNRYFMRCDVIKNSLEDFLGRLPDMIYIIDVAQLRSHIQYSPPLPLLLDDMDFALDPLAPGAGGISVMIEEFGSYEHVCLVTTGGVGPDIHGFHRVEVPILPRIMHETGFTTSVT